MIVVSALEPIAFWPVVQNTAVWWSPVVAGFIGAFGVHLLTQSREREKWILDSKKQEYRELLDALSASYSLAASIPVNSRAEVYNPIANGVNEFVRLSNDRIFIVKDLDLNTLPKRWSDSVATYRTNAMNADRFDKEYGRIRDEIVAAANRAVPKTTWQRLMFWKE
jgi:hypothetical protein